MLCKIVFCFVFTFKILISRSKLATAEMNEIVAKAAAEEEAQIAALKEVEEILITQNSKYKRRKTFLSTDLSRGARNFDSNFKIEIIIEPKIARTFFSSRPIKIR